MGFEENKNREENINRFLLRSVRTIETLKEYIDPIEFEKIFQKVLENQEIGPSTFWKEEYRKLPQEQRDFLEKQINEYKGLKGLMLKVFQHTSSGDLERRSLMDFSPQKIFRMVNLHKEIFGEYMSSYAKLVVNFLSFELFEAFRNRELSEAEKVNDRGHELNEEGRYEEALPYFNRALELSPRFCLAYVNKGIALKNLGRLDEAIACYDKVIDEIEPRYKKAWYNKAVALLMKGETDKARECVDKALEIEPSYQHALALKKKLAYS